MADVHSKKVRSYNMSRIRGKDTAPEMLVRKFLFSRGLRYRLHVKSLPGRPDIVLSSKHIVVLVQGCFWHGHKGCPDFVIPKTRTKWWVEKILSTRKRDKNNRAKLEAAGWKVIEIFTCEIKKGERGKKLNEIYSQIY